MMMDVAKHVIYQARMRSDAPAIVTTGGVASYTMLAKSVEAVCDLLPSLVLKPGDLVALDIKNPFHHVCLMLAFALNGITTASMQSRFSVEKTGILPAAYLTDGEKFEAPGSRVFVVDERWFAFDPAVAPDYGRLLALPGFATSDAVLRVVFSSGTTGIPKAVALTAGTLVSRIMRAEMGQAGPHSHSFKVINMMGFSTIAGILAPFIALSRGGTIAFASNNNDAIHLIRLFGIEVMAAAVLQLAGILKLLDGKPPLTSLRTVIAGGSKMPLRLLMEARARLCANVNFGYGSTEAGSMSFGTGAALERHEGSAGYVLPDVRIEAVDAQDQPVPAGQEGIIRVKTPEQAYYLNETQDTQELFRAGWFYPGDVGRIEPDGLVVITGRTSEIINRGGVIVAPDYIEEVLRTLPQIADVAVFGVPGPGGVDEIWAAVVSPGEIDAKALAEAVRPRLLDKVPNRFVRVEAIPRNDMGKTQRKALRDSLAGGH